MGCEAVAMGCEVMVMGCEVIFMKKEKAATNQYEVISPDTKLLEKRRKMYQIHEQFEAKKNDFRNQESTFKQGETDLKQKDKELQKKLISFCKFQQENQSKRKKAEERSKQEQKTYAQKQENIRSLQREIEQLCKNQKKYMNRVLHLRKYEDYLEKVRSSYNDQYPEMADILTRYQTLKKSNDDRIREREFFQQTHEALKKQALGEEKNLNQAILTINNEIKELSRKIEDRLHQKNDAQSEVEQNNEEFSKKNLNLGKIFMAIDNLHDRCNQNSHQFKYDFDEKNLAEKKDAKLPKKDDLMLNGDEVTYEQRSKEAAGKLKTILSHMRDFKTIIDDYRQATKHPPKDKADKY